IARDGLLVQRVRRRRASPSGNLHAEQTRIQPLAKLRGNHLHYRKLLRGPRTMKITAPVALSIGGIVFAGLAYVATHARATAPSSTPVAFSGYLANSGSPLG